MKINWLREWYTLLVAIKPTTWSRNQKTNWEWDAELWQLLLDGQIKFVGTHTAHIGDHIVWIENYPYASGSKYSYKDAIMRKNFCSRATAQFLQHELKTARMLTALKYTPEEQQKYFFDVEFPILKG